MSDLRFDINVDELVAVFGEIKETVSKDIKQAANDVASMTHAKTLELARNGLNSLQKIYTDNLSFSNPDENLWIITLNEKAMFVEEGRKAGSMIEDLLRNNAKTSKDGHRYKVIPFEHSKPPSQQSNTAQAMTTLIRGELKQRGINYKKLDLDKSGSPRTGLLHRFDVDNPRMSEKQRENLKGVAVYQTKQKDGSTRRDVMTFRVVTDNPASDAKWVHPGMEPKLFMDKALDWAMRTFENEMLPAILAKYE